MITTHLDNDVGAWCAFGYVTQAIGLAHTTPAKGAFICALFMVITPLINGMAGRRVGLPACLAVAIALMGTAILEGLFPGIGDTSQASAAVSFGAFNSGDGWCFGTAVGFGAMFSRMEQHMERLGDPDAALPLTAWQLVAIAVMTAAWHAADGGLVDGTSVWLKQAQMQPLLAPALLWMGLVTGAGVLWGETIALKQVPSTEAGVIFSTEPLWAAGFAALLLHDAIASNELFGGAAIVAYAFACSFLRSDSLH